MQKKSLLAVRSLLLVILVFALSTSVVLGQEPELPEDPVIVVPQGQIDPVIPVMPGLTVDKSAKISSGLQMAYNQFQNNAFTGTTFAPNFGSVEAASDFVVIDAIAQTDPAALLAELEALGLQNGSVFGRVVSGRLPVAAIPTLNGIANLNSARQALATTNVGLVTSEADQAMAVEPLRMGTGFDGAGQKVGILSDSFDCSLNVTTGGSYAEDIASGDLPDDVDILKDYNQDGCIDEGRAMAQLIYDLVPGADLAFYTAFDGAADFANGILALGAAGSTVIVDDIIYFAEPMFADGIIAQAADTVANNGIPYFSSAGNGARESYEAPFRNSGQIGLVGGEMHDFDPGPGVDTTQTVFLNPGQSFIISFQWDEPYASTSLSSPGSSSDLDIYFLDELGNPLFGSFGFNIGGDPVEITGVINNGTEPGFVQLVIEKFSGADPNLIKWVDFGGAPVEYATFSPSSYGHSNAAGAVSVGASAFFFTPAFGVNPPLLNVFSSAGGVPIFFDTDGNRLAAPEIRMKPEVTGVDGANTTFFFSDSGADADTFPNFFGTSASAPHTAAVAALMQQIFPGITGDEILAAMQDTAIDIVQRNTGEFIGEGFDFDSGAGLVQAEAAVDSLAFKSSIWAPLNNTAVPGPVGIQGWALDRAAGVGNGPGYDYIKIAQGTSCSGTSLAFTGFSLDFSTLAGTYGLDASYNTSGFEAYVNLPAGTQTISVCGFSSRKGELQLLTTRTVEVQ